MAGNISITAIKMQIMDFIIESNGDETIHVCSVRKKRRTVN